LESLPPEIVLYIAKFAGLFRTEVFESFFYLFFGVLVGEAKQGAVRSSVFSPADYQRSDFQIYSASISSRIKLLWPNWSKSL
jgi:hypothetical protein